MQKGIVHMREFNYQTIPNELLKLDIMNLVAAIHEYKGKQELFIAAKPDILERMIEVAKIQSTGASNRIEGIHTSDKRLGELIKAKAEPKNRSEQEIAGYREVLALIHESYEYMPPKSNVILQMHRDLYQYGFSSFGGHYKNSDNIITQTDITGTKSIRFKPLPAFETPEAIERLCETYIDSINIGECDPLILSSMFILDFLCIHPFNDGNGRMSRLLTLLLLYRSNYNVGKYISIEMIIEKTKETYYDMLAASSQGWHEGENSYHPFVRYMLEIILKAYKEFESRVEFVESKTLSKPDRIKNLFTHSMKKISKKEIIEQCPDISMSTVEVTLSKLVKEEYILKIGSGKNTTYIRNFTNQ